MILVMISLRRLQPLPKFVEAQDLSWWVGPSIYISRGIQSFVECRVRTSRHEKIVQVGQFRDCNLHFKKNSDGYNYGSDLGTRANLAPE